MLKHILLITSICILFGGCTSAPKDKVYSIEGETQGSYYRILYTANKADDKLNTKIDSLFKYFDNTLSLWVDSSMICNINNNTDLSTNPLFRDIFAKAMYASELTGGCFDITIAPLVKLYGFAKDNRSNKVFQKNYIDSILDFVGWKKVKIVDNIVVKENKSIQLDFNAIAQGYCADLVAELLIKNNLNNFLVDIGGEIVAKGEKVGGKSWVVGIEKPAKNAYSDRIIQTKLDLRNKALVTSGNYRKYFEHKGERFSHTINPENGLSVKHNLLSVCILCEKAWDADAIATACMVMGVEKSKSFLKENTKYEGFLIYSKGDSTLTWNTEGFNTY